MITFYFFPFPFGFLSIAFLVGYWDSAFADYLNCSLLFLPRALPGDDLDS